MRVFGGAMGLFGVPLGVATSMFAGMTLGIGVDYAIHLLERYRRARESGLDTQASLTDAVAATGPAFPCADSTKLDKFEVFAKTTFVAPISYRTSVTATVRGPSACEFPAS
ncbi:MAG: MMPL family transporter [Planctomycetes bacterium]|nr:MMPL family transporter [Planctomycetota bacterium]